MCDTPVIYCRFLKINGVAKKGQQPFSAEWGLYRPF